MTNMILAETAPAEIAPAEIASDAAVPAAGGSVSVTVAVIAAVAVIVIIVLIAVAVMRLRRKYPSFAAMLANLDLGDDLGKEVATLSLETVVSFFKEKSHLKALRGNTDLFAVAVKKEAKDGKTTVTLCLFDKKKGELFEPGTHAVVYVADALGNDLAEQFGDNDMILFH